MKTLKIIILSSRDSYAFAMSRIAELKNLFDLKFYTHEVLLEIKLLLIEDISYLNNSNDSLCLINKNSIHTNKNDYIWVIFDLKQLNLTISEWLAIIFSIKSNPHIVRLIDDNKYFINNLNLIGHIIQGNDIDKFYHLNDYIFNGNYLLDLLNNPDGYIFDLIVDLKIYPLIINLPIYSKNNLTNNEFTKFFYLNNTSPYEEYQNIFTLPKMIEIQHNHYPSTVEVIWIKHFYFSILNQIKSLISNDEIDLLQKFIDHDILIFSTQLLEDYKIESLNNNLIELISYIKHYIPILSNNSSTTNFDLLEIISPIDSNLKIILKCNFIKKLKLNIESIENSINIFHS